MCNRILAGAALVMMVSASPAYAQRVEVSGLFGWTLSDGVTGDPVLAADGNVYDTVDLKDGFSWGLAVGVNATDNLEVGFLFGQQQSTLALEGTAARDVGDLTINTYHPYVAFNAGAADAQSAAVSDDRPRRHQLRQRGFHAREWRRPTRPAARRSSRPRGAPA